MSATKARHHGIACDCPHRCYECAPVDDKYAHYRGGALVESPWDLTGAGDLDEAASGLYVRVSHVVEHHRTLAFIDRLDRLRLAVDIAREVAS
ncbi:hypothetical protein [Cellulomonas composti]|uniref:Uncharacterized protein n=1 Tax=Cellulomonas composti TaxID=266130 RepID=A0A511JBN3_9CELL|nr:hypothetical protein [Cellulomonas composti]GEL95392.1 hypothetical protein CCO02nite_20500 [Cellulomonas composti]